MSSSTTLLPLVLGVVAAVGNYTLLSRATTTHNVVALRADVKPGEPIKESHIYAVSVRGGDALLQSTVAYDQRDSLYGKTVRRPLKAGELVLKPDVEAHEHQVDFTALRDGESTLTLPGRLAAVDSRPYPGCHVMLVVRQVGPTAFANPLKSYGPFRFLGWSRSQNPRETDLISISLGVAASPGVNEPELRTLQADQTADRIVKVEILGNR